MIALELLALGAMALVFAATFARSAHSHTRALAWNTPSPASASATGHGTVIDATDRFTSSHARAFADVDSHAA